jgi:hypothetical protein
MYMTKHLYSKELKKLERVNDSLKEMELPSNLIVDGAMKD